MDDFYEWNSSWWTRTFGVVKNVTCVAPMNGGGCVSHLVDGCSIRHAYGHRDHGYCYRHQSYDCALLLSRDDRECIAQLMTVLQHEDGHQERDVMYTETQMHPAPCSLGRSQT